MWKLLKKTDLDVLEKTQENLQMSQKNTERLADAIERYLENQCKQADEKIKTEEEKFKAAYALNLCTVSVSQIIDYNDIFFLEKEYETILNNINIEEMPKDEALLRILKQLLDVITFFRIQEGERKFMEMEYRQKIKDAIWSAVPNLNVIVVGKKTVAIALSLATQIGTSYMNYRRRKSEIKLEKERKEWELQSSAMEQFNGLRRELFDTAWRLADAYEFPDEYRITERQITQFNGILLDENDMRRYERLEYIQDKFEAYPPFLYYLGHAANLVYHDLSQSDAIRAEYRIKAIAHFKKFMNQTKNNLLREDQLVASCALELFDLVDENKIQLLECAKRVSGNAYDVLQICALSYLKIGEEKETIGLLRMLVNEAYNEQLNSQILSKLYVSQFIEGNLSAKDDYLTLEQRVLRPECLYPMPAEVPKDDYKKEELNEEFLVNQKKKLVDDYANVLVQYIEKCEKRYKEICKRPGDITLEIAAFVREIRDAMGELFDEAEQGVFVERLSESLNASEEKIQRFERMLENWHERVSAKSRISFEEIFGQSFLGLIGKIRKDVLALKQMEDISKEESEVYSFQNQQNLKYMAMEQREIPVIDSIESMIFGEEYQKKANVRKKREVCLNILNRDMFSKEKVVLSDKKVEFCEYGDLQFKSYWKRNKLFYAQLLEIHSEYVPCESAIVAILNDKNFTDMDLIFTTEGIVVSNFKIGTVKAHYGDIDIDKSGKRLVIGGLKYNKSGVDIEVLNKLIETFARELEPYKVEEGTELAKQMKNHIESIKHAIR